MPNATPPTVTRVRPAPRRDMTEPVLAPAPLRPAVTTRYRLRRRSKRVIDIAAAVALLIALSPALTAIALLVRLTSRGPAFYRSERMGYKGTIFACIKFRTMYTGADELQQELEQQNEAQFPIFKIGKDPRVTRVGAWLRDTSLDELPQLFNVLTGAMSLVGPRPLPLRDCALLSRADRRRHDVRPGLTGVWQVTPNRHAATTDIIALDLDYVDNWSLRRDVKLLFSTVAVFTRGFLHRQEEPDPASCLDAISVRAQRFGA